MKDGRPSRTAYRVALRRASHQLLDVPRVLDDPLAIPILGHRIAAALRAEPRRFEASPFAPYVRAFLAVRSRLAEEQLARARVAGVRQYVIVGAGLDTSAYRDPTPELPLRVWEVDHPATQAWKRERLDEARIAIPARLVFVPVDFRRRSLAECLADAGFDTGAGALFSWLGVTSYLTPETVMSTLEYLASATRAGGGVVFDYAIAPRLLSLPERVVRMIVAALVRAHGEPWRSSFEPDRLVADLRELGFPVVRDLAAAEMNRRYLSNRTDGLRVPRTVSVMWAGSDSYAL